MSLDPNYMLAPSLEEYFVDKTTGLPLAGGKVYFYSDINRADFKDIFKLSGSPPNYSYTALPNPSTLSAVGTFQDELGNNILPYYFPFDADGNIENYYIEVYDSDGVLQFTREGFPNIASQSSNIDIANAVNYIPNGQFLLHSDILADQLNKFPVGRITKPITDIAQGGWTFERSVGTSSIDNVTFFRYGQYIEDPTASPRFAVQVVCSSPDISIVEKGLRIKFNDVNKFASETNQIYTLAFNASTFNSGDFVLGFRIIKFFGTGGSPSPTQIIPVTTFNITSTENLFQVQFTFGSNSGTNVGINNDDYVQLDFSFPTNLGFGMQATDFMLLIGAINVTEFQQTTDRDFVSRSLPTLVPNYDGSSYALAQMTGPAGNYYDEDSVGDIASNPIRTTKKGYLLCDGAQYLTYGVDAATGVPYSRLQSALYDSVANMPLFGTGLHFFTSALNLPGNVSYTDRITLSNNSAGVVLPVSDGSTPTGFSFSSIHVGIPSYGVDSFLYNGSSLINIDSFSIWNMQDGAVAVTTVGTSGFSLNALFDRTGSTLVRNVSALEAINATTLAGKYFTFDVVGTAYYVWYKVDGVGTDPAVSSRTGILVNLSSTDTAGFVSLKTSMAIRGFEVNEVIFTPASSINPGSFFNVYTFGGLSNYYYIWYRVDGAGTDPIPTGGIGIMVDVLSSDSVTNVQTKTSIAINKFMFAVPDYRGQFLRCLEPNPLRYDSGPRFSLYNPQLSGAALGTFEMDNNLSHDHSYVATAGSIGLQGGVNIVNLVSPSGLSLTNFSGGAESRPYNSAVNFFIKL